MAFDGVFWSLDCWRCLQEMDGRGSRQRALTQMRGETMGEGRKERMAMSSGNGWTWFTTVSADSDERGDNGGGKKGKNGESRIRHFIYDRKALERS